MAPAESVIRAVYVAIRDHDTAAFGQLIHPDIEVEQAPWLPYGGTYRGLEELGVQFREVLRIVDVGRLEVQSIVSEGDSVWAHIVVHARSDGSPVEVAEQWTLEDGRCRTLRVWYFDPTPLMRER